MELSLSHTHTRSHAQPHSYTLHSLTYTYLSKVASVTGFREISPLRQNPQSLGQFLVGFLFLGKIFGPTLANLVCH